MKSLIFTCIAAALVITACNSASQSEQEIQDSIAAAAAADSILNSAMEADTLSVDTLSTDSIQ